jgi:hypothetical protein
MARERAGDCTGSKSQDALNVCLGNSVASADKNLKSYESAIEELLSLKYPEPLGQPTTSAAATPELTGEQLAAEFGHMEKIWRSYLELALAATADQFNGTGAATAGMESNLRLVRGHMRELESIYRVRHVAEKMIPCQTIAGR